MTIVIFLVLCELKKKKKDQVQPEDTTEETTESRPSHHPHLKMPLWQVCSSAIEMYPGRYTDRSDPPNKISVRKGRREGERHTHRHNGKCLDNLFPWRTKYNCSVRDACISKKHAITFRHQSFITGSLSFADVFPRYLIIVIDVLYHLMAQHNIHKNLDTLNFLKQMSHDKNVSFMFSKQ